MLILHLPCLLTLLPLALPPATAVRPGDADVDERNERNERVLERLKAELSRSYVYKDAEQWLIGSLARNQVLGNYAGLDEATLARTVTADLRAWTSDKHFMLAHMPAFAAELEAAAKSAQPAGDTPADDPQEAASNFGIGRVEMLADGVGLIQLGSIAFSPGTVPAFQRALVSLPEACALVLDLRDNHGGSADTVPGLVSCFFPRGEKITLGTKYWRPDDAETPIETDPALGGVRYLDHPVLVLTSSETRSAAEALAYHLRAFGRAFVVGEKTSGGAHPADMVSLGDGFVALVPMGRVRSARTGTDWECRGVPIDMPCDAGASEERALDLALRLLEESR